MKKALLTIVVLTLVTTLLTAQKFIPAKIFTTSGDTLSGYIKDVGKKEKCLQVIFKKNKTDEVTKYNAEELRGYAFGEYRVYESASVSLAGEDGYARPFFLQKIVEGATDLYRLDYEYVEQKAVSQVQFQEAFFIIKPQGSKQAKVLLLNTYRSQLRNYFDNLCADRVQEINDNYRYTEEGLAKIVKAYNEACYQRPAKILLPEKSTKRRFKYQIGIGVQQTTIKNQDLVDIEYDFVGNPNLTVHALLEVPLFKFMAGSIGVEYLRLSTDNKRDVVVNEFYTNAGEVLMLRGLTKSTYLNVPARVKINFGQQKFQPYVYVGVSYALGLNTEITAENLTFVSTIEGDQQTKRPVELFTNISNPANEFVGYHLGVGFDVEISEQLTIFLSMHYQKGNNAIESDSGLRFNSDMFGVQLGIRL